MEVIASISTPRLLIRPFTEADWPGFCSFMLDERVTRFLVFTDEMKTENGARELLDATIAAYASESPMHAYAIADENGEFIGSCGVSTLENDSIYECYYSLLPSHWGNGYAVEAILALLNHCFGDPAVEEIRAYVSQENTASMRVAEKAGFESRGVQTHPEFGTKGLVYAMTRDRQAEQ